MFQEEGEIARFLPPVFVRKRKTLKKKAYKVDKDSKHFYLQGILFCRFYSYIYT